MVGVYIECVHVPWHGYGCQRPTVWSHFSSLPSTLAWFPGVKLKSSGLYIELKDTPGHLTGPNIAYFKCSLSMPSNITSVNMGALVAFLSKRLPSISSLCHVDMCPSYLVAEITHTDKNNLSLLGSQF